MCTCIDYACDADAFERGEEESRVIRIQTLDDLLNHIKNEYLEPHLVHPDFS